MELLIAPTTADLEIVCAPQDLSCNKIRPEDGATAPQFVFVVYHFSSGLCEADKALYVFRVSKSDNFWKKRDRGILDNSLRPSKKG